MTFQKYAKYNVWLQKSDSYTLVHISERLLPSKSSQWMPLLNPSKKRRTEIVSNEFKHLVAIEFLKNFRFVVQVLVFFLLEASVKGIFR